MSKFFSSIALLWLALSSLALQAQDLLPIPPLSGRVMDSTDTLTTAQQMAMAGKLQALESKMGTQVVVLMVPSVKPEDIADFSQRVGDSWKIGRRKEGDGLLVVVAKNDRKIRIQVAKALEGAIPDVAAARIIQNMMTPAFKAGDYAGGLNQAIDALGLRIQADGTPPPSASAPEAETMPSSGVAPETLSTWWPILLLLIPISGAFFLFVIVIGRKIGVLYIGGLVGVLVSSITKNWVIALVLAVMAMLTMFIVNLFARNTTAPVVAQRARSRAHSGSGVFWGAVASSSSWGGGSDSSSSNDIFSSGGGGDFGGGGASGDW
jgi:uncharacterized protein